MKITNIFRVTNSVRISRAKENDTYGGEHKYTQGILVGKSK